MKYNHAFSIAFELYSNHEWGDDITPAELRSAIQRRLDNLPDEKLIEAVGEPFDTIELD
jgi:hypothetical protein